MEESARNRSLEKKIDSYIKGTLSEEQTNSLWAELLSQPEYINYLETEITLSSIYQSERTARLELIRDDGKRQKSRLPAVRNNRWQWYSAAAAAIILAVIFTNIFINNNPSTIHQWANQKIGLEENLASASVTRSANAIPLPDSLLNAGFKAAIDGKVTRAIEIYHLVIKKYNDPVILAKANLNLGILQYNNSNFKISIQYFNTSITYAGHSELLKERAYWYMGNAYINIGHLGDALKAVSRAQSIGKIYNDEELKLIRRLNHVLKNQQKGTQSRSN